MGTRAPIEGRTSTEQASANLLAALAALALAPRTQSELCPHPLIVARAEAESALIYLSQSSPTLTDFPKWMTATPSRWAKDFLNPNLANLLPAEQLRQRYRDLPPFALAMAQEVHAVRSYVTELRLRRSEVPACILNISDAVDGVSKGQLTVEEARAALGRRCTAHTIKRLDVAAARYRDAIKGKVWALEASGERHAISGLVLVRSKKFASRGAERRAYRSFVAQQSVAAL